MQQKLQEKFTAHRRKDMTAMQTSQSLKGAEGTKDVSKARRVPESTKQSPKKRSAQAEKRKRKRQKAALANKATGQKATEQKATKQKATKQKATKQKVMERSKQTQAKPIDQEIARIATSMKSQTAAQLRTDIKASGSEDQKVNDSGSAGKASSKQRANSQKPEDIMNILDTSKDAKKSEDSAELVKRTLEVVTAVLKELQHRGGGSPDKDHRNAVVDPKSTFNDTSQSSKVVIHISFDDAFEN